MAWRDLSYLQFVPDWFVTREHTALWHDCLASEYCNNDEDDFFKWYEGYKKKKAQKASIKEELMSIAWHPSRYWDWWSSEDEKKRERKIVEVSIGFFVFDDQIQKNLASA